MKRLGLISGVAVCLVALLAGGVGAADEPQVIGITISPATLVLGSEGTWVTVHADIPLAAVDCSTVALDGIAVAWTKADAQVNLVAKFPIAKVKDIVAPPQATLELTGVTKDGTAFAGQDTIAVRKAGK
jgi:hypothetical protein